MPPFDYINIYKIVTTYIYMHVQGGLKNGLFFRLDNFVTVSPRKACSMSKFSKFYPEKRYKTRISHMDFTQFTLTYSETTVI